MVQESVDLQDPARTDLSFCQNAFLQCFHVFPSVSADKTEKVRRGFSMFFHPRPPGGDTVSSLKNRKSPSRINYDRLHRVMFNYTARVTFPLRRQRVQT